MFSLPDAAPWWAVAALAALTIVVLGVRSFVRAVWPQTSAHRKELLREWQRQREEERRRQHEQEQARQHKELDSQE
ncbi:hypothetical protein [Streptomyces buecherae]|uniref:hypothetical protein n=1 Tax=Streptomyces buecherae TaxID=2763006 RepID=UPI001C273B52|nr:hypothetical protein [Streptomyces buecherae]